METGGSRGSVYKKEEGDRGSGGKSKEEERETERKREKGRCS
jgi:hypothetical protein